MTLRPHGDVRSRRSLLVLEPHKPRPSRKHLPGIAHAVEASTRVGPGQGCRGAAWTYGLLRPPRRCPRRLARRLTVLGHFTCGSPSSSLPCRPFIAPDAFDPSSLTRGTNGRLVTRTQSRRRCPAADAPAAHPRGQSHAMLSLVEPGVVLAFVIASMALHIVPGPGMMLILAHGIAGGRCAGFTAAMGMAVGTATHTVAAVVGPSALLAVAPAALDVVRIVGAGPVVSGSEQSTCCTATNAGQDPAHFATDACRSPFSRTWATLWSCCSSSRSCCSSSSPVGGRPRPRFSCSAAS